VAGHRLRLTFSDGYVREIDFEPFLTSSVHPQIRRYLDLEMFLNFRLEEGDLVWGEYELCFAIADLYTGQL